MTKNYSSILNAKLKDHIVILRADLDLPIINGEIRDDYKIKVLIPTIEYLQKANCKIIILSHLGNPKGKVSDELSLMPIRFEIGRLIGKPIKFANILQCENSIKFMDFGDILMLENLKFYEEEESLNAITRKKFISALGSIANVYISECFNCQDKFASLFELPKKINNNFLGFNFLKELESIELIKSNLNKSSLFLLGGTFSPLKLDFLKSIIDKVQTILVSGEIAYTFLNAKGIKVGESYVNKEYIKNIQEIFLLAEKNNCEIILPEDHKIISVKDDSINKYILEQEIPDGFKGIDLGKKTIISFKEYLSKAENIIWYGVTGKIEKNLYTSNTEIGEFISLSTLRNAYKIVAGDNTVESINLLKIKHKRFNHLSTGDRMFLSVFIGNKSEVLNLFHNNN